MHNLGDLRSHMSLLRGDTSTFLNDETKCFAQDVKEGFASPLKSIPSRWLYDARGSRLFSRITRLPEYYPTARELDILESSAADMGKLLSCQSRESRWRVVELGAGDGRKTELLLRAWIDNGIDLEYSPIDVSSNALDSLCSRMSLRLGGMKCQPVVGDNLMALRELSWCRSGERLCVLFLGSSIGNCEWDDVDMFLSGLRARLEPGDVVVIGFDLLKDSRRLLRAYDDSQGVTRDFNLNLLERMNRELGANFELDWFRHEATWNPGISGMESWLVSLRDQVVAIAALGETYHFRKWEPIRTEVSLKFDPEGLDLLAVENGFLPLRRYEDGAGDFTDAVWMVPRAQILA